VVYRVDGVAEDQVLNAVVSVGDHDEQIGMDLVGIAWVTIGLEGDRGEKSATSE
jgi:hypothetical protein